MSGIAEVLLNLGFTVSGSDLKTTPVTDRLSKLGARVSEGHAASHLQDAQVVVVSSAVRADNPEVEEAHRLQIPVIPRAEMLAELMRLKFCVAVAGAHGKTTVTSMIAVILTQAALDPTAVIGGRLDVFASSARLGKGELMVVEADESDRSFLYLLPSIAVITNIDREHLDHYRDLDEITSAFLAFANKVPFYGAVVACSDAPWGGRFNELLPHIRRRVVTYGLESGAHVRGSSLQLQPQGSSFEVDAGAKHLGSFSINVPGRHNAQNSLAAVAVGLELGLSTEQIREGLACFRGADRRFQVKMEFEGVTIVDDYGHHPAEIRATLDAARLWGAKRVIAIFQPHRYTRTQFLMDDFARCFEAADHVYILDIYPASESPIQGVTAERLVERMAELGYHGAEYAPSEQSVIKGILGDVRRGDLILTVGAGSVWKIGDALAAEIRNRPARAGVR